MDVFAQKKMLMRIVIGLVVLNVLSLAGMWFISNRNAPPGPHTPPPPPPPPAEQLMNVLQSELKLTREQAVQFEKIRNEYLAKENEVLAKLRAGRDSMNTLMFSEHTDSLQLYGVARRVADNEMTMESLRIEQAAQLKRICSPEQLKRFAELMRELRDYLKPEGPNGPPGRK